MQQKNGQSISRPLEWRIVLVIFLGLLPVLAIVLLFAILIIWNGSGTFILDASRWPGVVRPDCMPINGTCAAPDRFEVVLRIISVCGAFFLLFNKPSQMITLTRVASELDNQPRTKNLVAPTAYLLVISIFVNAIWIAMIYYAPYAGGVTLETAMTILMFLLFGAGDVVFMWLHAVSEKYSDRVEFNYFFGNAFFIDLPTLFGLVMLWILTTWTVQNGILTDGLMPKALANGGLVMHVVFSQVVFSFLQIQMGINRLRPATQV